MTTEELAQLLDDTADAINLDNWLHESYFSGDSLPETAFEVQQRKNCRACAMGRMVVLFCERGYKIESKRDAIIAQVEDTIDAAFSRATGDHGYSLSAAIIDENDHDGAHVVDIQGFLHARAKEVRDA